MSDKIWAEMEKEFGKAGKTPTCDKEKFIINWIHDTKKSVVAVEEAEKLERELNEAKKLIHDTAQGIVQGREDNLHTVLKTAQSRDDYRECCEKLATAITNALKMNVPGIIIGEKALKEALEEYRKLQQKGQP